MEFAKYQALGNDYIVVSGEAGQGLTEEVVRRICDRHFGLGSDGILVDESLSPEGPFRLRILNPDGSEAEKSGNGLRIFSRWLWDHGRVREKAFDVATLGGAVRCEVREGGREVFVEMGRARFDSQAIPVAGPPREVVDEVIEVGGKRLRMTAVTVGNPHCVIHCPVVSESLARELGPLVETHELFPNRTNVQLAQVLAQDRIRIEIWERGAGYTLASGSSACAAAAASVRLVLCGTSLTVEMPGGELAVEVFPGFALTMRGGVGHVADGCISEELLRPAALR